MEVVRRGHRERHPGRLGDRRREPQRRQRPRINSRGVARAELRVEIEPVHPDPGYDNPETRAELAGLALNDLIIGTAALPGSESR
jgi:hypothetical protein